MLFLLDYWPLKRWQAAATSDSSVTELAPEQQDKAHARFKFSPLVMERFRFRSYVTVLRRYYFSMEAKQNLLSFDKFHGVFVSATYSCRMPRCLGKNNLA